MEGLISGGGSVISGIKKNVSKRTSHTSVDRNTVIQQRDQGGLFPGGAYNRGGGGGGLKTGILRYLVEVKKAWALLRFFSLNYNSNFPTIILKENLCT